MSRLVHAYIPYSNIHSSIREGVYSNCLPVTRAVSTCSFSFFIVVCALTRVARKLAQSTCQRSYSNDQVVATMYFSSPFSSRFLFDHLAHARKFLSNSVQPAEFQSLLLGFNRFLSQVAFLHHIQTSFALPTNH